MEQVRLPLFPLNVVLFPGSVLPLHIFEERYKLLIKECSDRESEFGMNFTTDEGIADVGCTATVASVEKVYDDGKMDIHVRGNRRYRLQSMRSDLAPYAVGFVRFLDEELENMNGALLEETIGLYNELIATAYGTKLPPVSREDTGTQPSFRLAQKAGMDLGARQQLLETFSENERLTALRAYLKSTLPKLQKAEEIYRVIKGDGYL